MCMRGGGVARPTNRDGNDGHKNYYELDVGSGVSRWSCHDYNVLIGKALWVEGEGSYHGYCCCCWWWWWCCSRGAEFSVMPRPVCCWLYSPAELSCP